MPVFEKFNAARKVSSALKPELLFESGYIITLHVVAAVLTFIVGLVVLWRRKGGYSHRITGRVWVVLMFTVAFSSLFISEIKMIGRFSPIHALSLYVMIALVWALYAARTGDIERHQSLMKNQFIFGTLIAGAFTFLPHRLLAHVLGDGLLAKGAPFVWLAIPVGLYAFYQYQRNRPFLDSQIWRRAASK